MKLVFENNTRNARVGDQRLLCSAEITETLEQHLKGRTNTLEAQLLHQWYMIHDK